MDSSTREYVSKKREISALAFRRLRNIQVTRTTQPPTSVASTRSSRCKIFENRKTASCYGENERYGCRERQLTVSFQLRRCQRSFENKIWPDLRSDLLSFSFFDLIRSEIWSDLIWSFSSLPPIFFSKDRYLNVDATRIHPRERLRRQKRQDSLRFRFTAANLIQAMA